MNRSFLGKLGILSLVLAISLSSCKLPWDKDKDDSGGGGTTVYQIEYKVTGTASTVLVTYQNKDSGTSQEYVSIPWSYSFSAIPGTFVYISAQNQGDTGSVTVTIYKDSTVLKTSTSSGAYVIATASDSL